MSSTTSSDCENCDCSQCTYLFENNHNDYGKLLINSRHVPMYTTMAHPLVYYAEVQQPNRKQTYNQPRKDNPFKKAFKWYTQERTLYNKNDVAPEKSGFANWLDNKYVEYLRQSGQQTKESPTSHEPRTQRTSIAESCPPCPATTKTFGRFKSPWRKRRHLGKDSGDVSKKCPNGSCEFLLQPKELTRAASETCYHTPTSGDKSNSTVASSNMPCNTKCSRRSQSLSDVSCEKSVLKHGNPVPHTVQEYPNCQDQAPTKLATTSGACHQKQGLTKLPKSMRVCPQEQGPSKEKDTKKQPTTLCKCPQEKVVKVPSKEQNASNQLGQLCKCLQEKVEEVVKVPSNASNASNQPGPLSKVVQKEVPRVPSKEQDPTNHLGPCCKCNLEKVTKVVQVPSQSRAVEQSSQYPEEKIVPVHEETQYQPIPETPCYTQNLGPCCCKTCNMPIAPPPQLVCVPVKVQSNKIANPEMCFTIAPAQIDAPKKQKAKQLSVSCQTQTQHQPEPSASCKYTAPNQNNCHEVNQVFGPIPIRRQSYSTVAINEETGEYTIVKEVSVVNKFTRSVTCASNDAAQTSDHSIRFEKDACSYQCPLLFKIIYADISKNE